MIWFIVMHLFSTLLEWVRIGQLTEHGKDLEILLLRQQLGIAQRKLQKPVPSSRVERLTVTVVATRLKSATGRATSQLHQVIRIFLPETVLRSVMSEYVNYYNTARPRQGIDLQKPIHQTTQSCDGPIRCRNVLGGVIHDYYRKPA